jgi:hypothetical protein
MEFEANDDQRPHDYKHMRVSLAASVLISVVVGAFSAGITQGIGSQRVAILEERTRAAEAKVDALQASEAQLRIQTAVTQSQYQEILRRLERIDVAIAGSDRQP